MIDTFKIMNYDPLAMTEVVLVCVIGAISLVLIVDGIFRRAGLIEKGDFSLQSDL